ncbi:hypothetical protein [Mangrovicoccus sp. HB161399]|uniref:hypothetical protein n=1 Tax=Mangrovicoccus sp. HB161399 TaxID=2720392 RepID=UPI001556D64A|nr:hypothetical protein [Mangrovicoccus sp. HB161399]
MTEERTLTDVLAEIDALATMGLAASDTGRFLTPETFHDAMGRQFGVISALAGEALEMSAKNVKRV